MAFCQKCGAFVPDGETLCTACVKSMADAQDAPRATAAVAAVAADDTPVTSVENAADAPCAPHFQPDFSQAPAPVYTPVQPSFRLPLTGTDIPPEYKPLGAWTYFLYALLFSLPLVGLVSLIVLSCGGTNNLNLRNYARSYFCGLLVAVVVIAIAVGLFVGLGWNAGDMARELRNYYFQ